MFCCVRANVRASASACMCEGVHANVFPSAGRKLINSHARAIRRAVLYFLAGGFLFVRVEDLVFCSWSTTETHVISVRSCHIPVYNDAKMLLQSPANACWCLMNFCTFGSGMVVGSCQQNREHSLRIRGVQRTKAHAISVRNRHIPV